VLYSFSGSDGSFPEGGVVLDHAGNLFGTTDEGGLYGFGTVFELSPPSVRGSSWTETALWNFSGGSDGGTPGVEALVFDSGGNLYGTTYFGGDSDKGTAFELSPSAGGEWNESVLHSFGDGQDGANPTAGLVMTTSGVLTGTTQKGGTHAVGTAFALTPPTQQGGVWSYTVLYNFGGFRNDGATPQAGLTVGNRVLYGTTAQGGASDPVGTIFELMPQNGHWVEKILYNFGAGQSPNGRVPDTGVLIHNGALFGTASEGGNTDSDGAVYELLLPSVPE
jgi:uncharacterized repeat protein (TIGR03803 family)